MLFYSRLIGLLQEDEHFISGNDVVCSDSEDMENSNYDNCKIETAEKWLNCSLPWGNNTSKINEKFDIGNYFIYSFLGLNGGHHLKIDR